MIEELRILDEKSIFDTDAHYMIPRYQRAYAWEDKEIGQLIDDVNDFDSSNNYYIGSLIVSNISQNPMKSLTDNSDSQRCICCYII